MLHQPQAEADLDIAINLTALIDVMTNLLFFLLLGFGAQAVTSEIEDDVQLPVSSAEQPTLRAPELALSPFALKLDHQTVATLRGGKVVGSGPGRIAALYHPLMRRRAGQSDTQRANDDALVILCDEKTSYRLLHQVLDTAAEAGFIKFRMAVLMP